MTVFPLIKCLMTFEGGVYIIKKKRKIEKYIKIYKNLIKRTKDKNKKERADNMNCLCRSSKTISVRIVLLDDTDFLHELKVRFILYFCIHLISSIIKILILFFP